MRKRIRFVSVCISGLLVASGFGLSSPATASSSDALVHSLNHAGYTAVPPVARGLTASWVQPAAKCGSGTTFSLIRVGLVLSDGHGGLQMGTALDCRAGQSHAYAWVRGHHDIGSVVEAGDHMLVTMDAGGGHYEYTLEDKTQGWGVGGATDAALGAYYNRAVFAVQGRTGSDGVLPLTPFSPIAFSKCVVNNRPLASVSHRRVVMRSADGTVKASPSAVTGGEFTVRWRQS